MPVNWSAYEDIADFFTNDVKEIDGVQIFGHMDYGKRAPDLGWRMTDAWLSMAGTGSEGEPNGIPIDEWGIRMEAGSCNPEGASVSRGGEANGPASVYAIAKWDEWLRKYAPPGAASYDFYQSLPALSQGNVAQQIFWYTAFISDMVKPKSEGNNTVDDEGMPLWRMAPSPHGPYWQEGQKVGYQDVGSWTILKSTPVDRAKAAWLYAQFVTSKTVDTKKSHVGLTFIRDSTVRGESFTERAPKLGGLVEFYRSPDRVRWSPTGINVPDYPKLAQIWWQQIGDVNSGAFTAAGGHGPACGGDGCHHGAHAAGRRGRQCLRWLRSAAERSRRPGRLARQAGRPEGKAREREAAGRDRELRRSRQAVGRGQLTDVHSPRSCGRRDRSPRRPEGLSECQQDIGQ